MVDYSDAVELLIKSDSEKIKNEIFNVGYQNLSIYQIAKLVKKVVENQFSEKKNIEIITGIPNPPFLINEPRGAPIKNIVKHANA